MSTADFSFSLTFHPAIGYPFRLLTLPSSTRILRPLPAMITNILRDAETTKKLLEAILDTSNGKRSLSRLARVCRAMCEPALDVLWRDLDSIVPILGLFPASVLKKARRPGLGFVSSQLCPPFTIHN